MTPFATTELPSTPDAIAPDGSEVRLLCRVAGGSMAHFRLPPGACSKAVVHRTVEELWFVTAGEGELWRRGGGEEDIVALRAGVSVTIPVGTVFQFRAVPRVPSFLSRKALVTRDRPIPAGYTM